MSKTEDLYRQNIGKLVKYSYINDHKLIEPEHDRIWLIKSVVKVDGYFYYEAMGLGGATNQMLNCSSTAQKIKNKITRERFMWEFI